MSNVKITEEILYSIVINNFKLFGFESHYIIRRVEVMYEQPISIVFIIYYKANVYDVKKIWFTNQDEINSLYKKTLKKIRLSKIKKLTNSV